MFRVIMIKVMNCDGVACDEFPPTVVVLRKVVVLCEVVVLGEVVVLDEVVVLYKVVVSYKVEFSYILASLSMSFALNPSLWPMIAFASCSNNRYLNFSYRLTQYIQSYMKQESYI